MLPTDQSGQLYLLVIAHANTDVQILKMVMIPIASYTGHEV